MMKRYLEYLLVFALVAVTGAVLVLYDFSSSVAIEKKREAAIEKRFAELQKTYQDSFSDTISDNIFAQTFVDPFIAKGPFQKGVITSPSSHILSSGSDTEKKDALSEEDLFSRLWPAFYITYLHTMESIMREDGFITHDKKFSFNTDDDIYDFLLLVVDYFEHKNMVAAAHADRLRRGISGELAPLIDEEKDLIRKQAALSTQSLFEKSIALEDRKNRPLKNILDEFIFSLLVVQRAHAQETGGGNEVDPAAVQQQLEEYLEIDTGGGCYKDNAPFFLVPGPNLWAPCCNCCAGCAEKQTLAQASAQDNTEYTQEKIVSFFAVQEAHAQEEFGGLAGGAGGIGGLINLGIGITDLQASGLDVGALNAVAGVDITAPGFDMFDLAGTGISVGQLVNLGLNLVNLLSDFNLGDLIQVGFDIATLAGFGLDLGGLLGFFGIALPAGIAFLAVVPVFALISFGLDLLGIFGDCKPIGCLNAVCASWPNAIWDPDTGICGCG